MRILILSLACLAMVLGACAENGNGGPEYEFNGFLEQVDGMRVLWLWGTHEEMGYAEGALMCGSLTRTIQEMVYSNEAMALGVDTVVSVIESMVDIPIQSKLQMRGIISGLQDHCPADELILESEYLEGGSRPVQYEDLLIQNFNGPVVDYMCSSLTVWGEASHSGETLQARNVDTGSGDYTGVRLTEKLVKVYRSSQDGDARWLSVNLPGRLGCTTCFSEEGAGISAHWANSSALPPSASSGFVSNEMANNAALISTLGSADPLESAHAVYDASPRSGGNNMHMCLPCDGDGCIGGVVFEYDGGAGHPDGLATDRRPGDVDDGLQTLSATVCTNHFMERVDLDPPPANSMLRYQTLVDGVNANLASGGLDPAGALEQMAAVMGVTYYTTIIDTSDMTLYLRYAESAEVPAPLTEPHVLPLDDMFERFP